MTIPISPEFAKVPRLLGTPVKGSFDSGAWVVSVSTDTGKPSTIAVPIEVRNRRLALYPIHKEVHRATAIGSSWITDPLEVRRRPQITSHSASRNSPMKVNEETSVQEPRESTVPKLSIT
jgi:hypothetical protein